MRNIESNLDDRSATVVNDENNVTNVSAYYEVAEQMADAIAYSLVLLGRVAENEEVKKAHIEAAEVANRCALLDFWALTPYVGSQEK